MVVYGCFPAGSFGRPFFEIGRGGVVAAEHGARRALFLVHEFLGATDRRNVERNAADLEAVVRRLGWKGEVGADRIAGPFRVPGGGRVPSDVELFIGKVQRSG